MFLVEPSAELDRAVTDNIRYKDSTLFCSFTTVDEYLHDLEVICKQLNCLGPKAIIYLAAAVSDFYIHEEKQVYFESCESIYFSIFSQSTKCNQLEAMYN
jgi:hypothetical protein